VTSSSAGSPALGATSATSPPEVMSKGLVHCFVDQDISEAARIMKDRQVRRLLVLKPNNKPVGIISLGDLAEANAQLAGEALQGVSQPSEASRRD
jgi:predicted transcriptional regulator